MRKSLLILPALLLFTALFSQDSLLKKFKFRNVNYRAVTFTINGSGQYNNTDYAAGTNKGHAYGGNLGTSWYAIKSTDRILFNASAGFSVSGNAYKAENTFSPNKNSSFNFNPVFNVLTKWFNKKFFTELGADGSVYLSDSKTKWTGAPGNAKNGQHNYSLAVTAGIGKGRPENVMDMQNALWLNDALEKEGRLSRSLSAEELYDLGRAITVANNTRVLDSRKRTRFLLETVDNYFQQKGLISSTDIKYFSNLNDILFFAFNNPRLSGTEKYLRITPAISHYNYGQSQSFPSSNSKDVSAAKSVHITSGISRYKPVNLRHQNNYGIGVQAGYLENNGDQKYFVAGTLVNEIKSNPVLRQIGINLFFQHAIYPNTRTIISFDLRSEAGHEKIDQQSDIFGTVNFYSTINYFISYRTLFTANIGAIYQSNVYRMYNSYLQLQPDNLQFYASAGLQVSL